MTCSPARAPGAADALMRCVGIVVEVGPRVSPWALDDMALHGDYRPLLSFAARVLPHRRG